MRKKTRDITVNDKHYVYIVGDDDDYAGNIRIWDSNKNLIYDEITRHENVTPRIIRTLIELVDKKAEIIEHIKSMSNTDLLEGSFSSIPGDEQFTDYDEWEHAEYRKELNKRLKEIGFLPNGEIKLFNREISMQEVFAIQKTDNGIVEAFIGYKIPNGNFHFESIPYTEHVNGGLVWRIEDLKQKK